MGTNLKVEQGKKEGGIRLVIGERGGILVRGIKSKRTAYIWREIIILAAGKKYYGRNRGFPNRQGRDYSGKRAAVIGIGKGRYSSSGRSDSGMGVGCGKNQIAHHQPKIFEKFRGKKQQPSQNVGKRTVFEKSFAEKGTEKNAS